MPVHDMEKKQAKSFLEWLIQLIIDLLKKAFGFGKADAFSLEKMKAGIGTNSFHQSMQQVEKFMNDYSGLAKIGASMAKALGGGAHGKRLNGAKS